MCMQQLFTDARVHVKKRGSMVRSLCPNAHAYPAAAVWLLWTLSLRPPAGSYRLFCSSLSRLYPRRLGCNPSSPIIRLLFWTTNNRNDARPKKKWWRTELYLSAGVCASHHTVHTAKALVGATDSHMGKTRITIQRNKKRLVLNNKLFQKVVC